MALEQHVPSQSSLASRVLRANAALRTPQRSQPMTAALSIKPWPPLCPNQGVERPRRRALVAGRRKQAPPSCCSLRADVHVPESKETNCGEGIVYVRFVRLRRCERGVAPARRLSPLSRMQGFCLVGVEISASFHPRDIWRRGGSRGKTKIEGLVFQVAASIDSCEP